MGLGVEVRLGLVCRGSFFHYLDRPFLLIFEDGDEVLKVGVPLELISEVDQLFELISVELGDLLVVDRDHLLPVVEGLLGLTLWPEHI